VLVPRTVRLLARGVGAAGGLVAGQAWESEERVPLRAYHQAKTGALFEAAAAMGAALARVPEGPWAAFGAAVGEAYQVADDLRDTLGDLDSLGKPANQDETHERPNAALALGVSGAVTRLEKLIACAIGAVPTCEDPARVLVWMEEFGSRLLPSRGAPAVARRRQTDGFAAVRPT
jgi:geranylgeranyl diphosphate synthase type II